MIVGREGLFQVFPTPDGKQYLFIKAAEPPIVKTLNMYEVWIWDAEKQEASILYFHHRRPAIALQTPNTPPGLEEAILGVIFVGAICKSPLPCYKTKPGYKTFSE
jgi:hypothetical protein